MRQCARLVLSLHAVILHMIMYLRGAVDASKQSFGWTARGQRDDFVQVHMCVCVYVCVRAAHTLTNLHPVTSM
jgi:hypothetical protein